MLTQLFLIAQATSAPSGGSGQPGGLSMIYLFLPFMFILYFVMIRPQNRDRKQQEAMLAAIKKNDRVVTKGGITGTVTAVRDNEVTLKVDESSNTKITFEKWAIHRITTVAPQKEGDSRDEK